MLNYLPRYLKIILITGFACISHLADAGSNNNNNHNHNKAHPPTLVGVDKFKYKIGDPGPGGGFIFFVDYYDQYPDFTYLEAAPNDAIGLYSGEDKWCDDTTTSISGATGWTANAIGRGHANTVAMLAGCRSGAAWSANNYTTSSTQPGEWFLPSLGEAMLMYTNLRQAGVGNFGNASYWSSTEAYSGSLAWIQAFWSGQQYNDTKELSLFVRAVRSF